MTSSLLLVQAEDSGAQDEEPSLWICSSKQDLQARLAPALHEMRKLDDIAHP